MNNKGFAHLVLILILVIAVAVVYFVLQTTGQSLLPGAGNNQTVNNNSDGKVVLKTDYQNPFDKNTQYVNPFASYKNPFDNLR